MPKQKPLNPAEKTKTVLVRAAYGTENQTEAVPVRRWSPSGHLAVTVALGRNPGEPSKPTRYVVTHVPTGYKAAGSFKLMRHAVTVMLAADIPSLDWSFTSVKSRLFTKQGPAMARAIRAAEQGAES